MQENPSLTPLARIVGYGIAGVEPTVRRERDKKKPRKPRG